MSNHNFHINIIGELIKTTILHRRSVTPKVCFGGSTSHRRRMKKFYKTIKNFKKFLIIIINKYQNN